MGDIKEHQKAKLSFKTADNSEKEFECLIKEIQKDRLLLEFPEEILQYAEYLEEGSELPVKIFTPTGVNVFDTIVLNSPLESDFVIEYIENSIKIQRREYPRVDVVTKVIIARNNEGNVVTKTLDISGGGIRFFLNGSFKQNEEVGILLYLPFELNSIKARGVVLDKSHLDATQHVLLFTQIEERDREKIIQKCFKLQLDKYKEIENLE